MSDLKLGPFEIGELLGRGGMGVVFRAVHETDGTPVAVKIIVSERAHTRWFRLAFRREIQAMARLTHPGISAILDTGVLGEQQSPDDTFREKRPWFAMEYVDGPPLQSVRSWSELRAILLSLLDALAHAHALGVIHRDIKPSNILVSDGGPKLVDFGLASFVEEVQAAEQQRVLGTPNYMAPEQILGRWRDQGPWTDLYSLGCVAWLLACGEELASEETTDGILHEHLKGITEGKGFRPRFAVPEGFEQWLETMLFREWSRRFQRAADAAFALARLSSPEPDSGEAPPVFDLSEISSATTLVDDGPTTVVLKTIADATEPLPGSEEQGPAAEYAMAPPVPGHPPSEPPVATSQMRGAGLGLFGLRLIPVVDRNAERDALWQALRRVDAEHQPRVAVLQGAPGNGKTRLAEWLAHRSHEVGATTVLRASHDPDGAHLDGLGGMLARHFRCVGLERRMAEGRIRQACKLLRGRQSMSSYDVSALARLTTPAEEEPSQRVTISPTEKFLVVQRLLSLLSEERAVLLWMDDAELSAESLGFVRSLLDPGIKSPLRALVVLTIGENPRNPLLGPVLDHDRTMRLQLGPLGRDDQLELVQRLLRLEPRLANEVATRTEGSPLFAVQLVGDWVERGVLRLGEQGFVAETSDGDVPDDIHELWAERLQRTMSRLGARSDAFRRAMEIGAALGRDVDDAEWRAACYRAGVRETDEFVELMHRQGLVRGTDRGWRFAHGMLRESVIRVARESGRYSGEHQLCAETLREMHGADSRGTPRRLATHFLEADRREDALEHVFEAAREAWRFAEYAEANEWLDRHDDVLDQLKLPPTDRRRIRAAWLRGFVMQESGRPDDAKAVVDEAIYIAEQAGWHLDYGNLCRLEGNILRDQGEFDQSLDWYRKAEQALDLAGAREGVGLVYSGRGGTLLKQGKLREARECLERADTVFTSTGNEVMRARTAHHIGYTYVAQGNYDAARDAIGEAMRLAQSSGNRVLEANCWNNLGEAARFESNWDEAADDYERAADLWAEAGHRDADIARINLAMVHVAAGRYRRAGPLLAVLEAKFERVGFKFAMPVIHAGRACVAIHAGDVAEFDERLDSLEALLEETGLVERDLAWLAEHAADLAAEAGDLDRARRAWRVSQDQWKRLDEAGEAGRITRKLRQAHADG